MKKKLLKVITTVVTVIIAVFLVLVGYLTITEFKNMGGNSRLLVSEMKALFVA